MNNSTVKLITINILFNLVRIDSNKTYRYSYDEHANNELNQIQETAAELNQARVDLGRIERFVIFVATF